MKMVCGQAHPQNNRPNMTVNKIMNTIKVIIVKPNKKKSCGPKTTLNKINLRVMMLSIKKGKPFTLINGMPTNIIKKKAATMVL